MNGCCHNAPNFLTADSVLLWLLLFVHGCNLLWRGLHNVVASRTLHPILVGIVVNHGQMIAEIGVRRRGGGRAPLERGALPRIVWRWFAPEPAVNQVVDKNQLGSARDEGGNSNE